MEFVALTLKRHWVGAKGVLKRSASNFSISLSTDDARLVLYSAESHTRSSCRPNNIISRPPTSIGINTILTPRVLEKSASSFRDAMIDLDFPRVH
jgi:hypothetical protein